MLQPGIQTQIVYLLQPPYPSGVYTSEISIYDGRATV